jgi:hypothetical protein
MSIGVVRQIAWRRALEAMGKHMMTSDTRAALEARYPSTAKAIAEYLAAREKCHTDRQRAEARDRLLAPHCAALATRSLAAMQDTGLSKEQRLARLRASLGR